jgi:hypothetical protein
MSDGVMLTQTTVTATNDAQVAWKSGITPDLRRTGKLTVSTPNTRLLVASVLNPRSRSATRPP